VSVDPDPAATGAPPSGEPLLTVEDLKVSFATEEGVVQAVEAVSFELAPGEILAVVGESGSGKSVTAMTLMGLTRSPNADFEGTAHYKGTELVHASEDQLRRVRGAEIAMIFQDPMTSLNPVHKIGRQIVEQIQEHEALPDQQARERAVELLDRVGIPRARERIDNYPFEFSGGMRQRVMIALALSCNPSVLIADEPTTALDVTIQAQILQRMRELRDETGAAIILVTHDLGVVADIADRIAVMYSGRIVEQGTLDEIFYDPQHPYTWGLLGGGLVLDLVLGLAHAAPASDFASSPISPGRTSRRSRFSSGVSQHLSRWAGAPSSLASSGGTSLHLPNSCGQRGLKWQPCGRSASDGGRPAIAGRRSGRGRSTRAIEPSRPHVYGCCGS